jgi:hypothetical protein
MPPTYRYWRPGKGLEPFDPAEVGPRTVTVTTSYAWFFSSTKEVREPAKPLEDLSDTPGGIAIAVDIPEYRGMTDMEGRDLSVPAEFGAYTVNCLRLLYATHVGKRILDLLLGKNVIIQSDVTKNACRGGSLMTSVAQEILSAPEGGGVPLPGIAGIVERKMVCPGGADRYAFLAKQINEQPHLSLDAVDGAAPPVKLDVTKDEVRRWIEQGANITRLSANQRNQLKLATIAALEIPSTKAGMSSSTVAFCISRTNDLNLSRPPAIGLGHELIHSYFYATGEQPGRDFGHYSTALYEFKCIGMGPWRDANVSENVLRSQWAYILRNYGDRIDDLNRRTVARRTRY